jgi:mono/diheme cytochrome c family protein
LEGNVSRIIGRLLRAGLTALLSLPALAQNPAEMDAASLYAQACAACHGVDGGGLAADSPLAATFDSSPASFLDPLFNSREPAADWFLVVKHGGKKIGLSDKMPAYGEALSDAQIDEVVGYLKTLAGTDRYPPGELNLTRPIATTKAFPEDEALIIHRWEPRDQGADALFTTLYYARRFGPRGHGEVKLTHESRARLRCR